MNFSSVQTPYWILNEVEIIRQTILSYQFPTIKLVRITTRPKTQWPIRSIDWLSQIANRLRKRSQLRFSTGLQLRLPRRCFPFVPITLKVAFSKREVTGGPSTCQKSPKPSKNISEPRKWLKGRGWEMKSLSKGSFPRVTTSAEWTSMMNEATSCFAFQTEFDVKI